jgi:G3E family GTPase
VLPSVKGNVPLDRIMGTRRFNMEKASQSAAWIKELQIDHTPETEEYGIGNFVFRARGPFHPQRFWDFIHRDWPGLLRSKGYFWIASRPHIAAVWSQAGGMAEYRPGGYWWAATPKANWPTDPDSLAWIESKMEEPWGDRRQELVFIGQTLPREEMLAELNAALLTPEELKHGIGAWPKILDDPFPAWEENLEEVEA